MSRASTGVLGGGNDGVFISSGLIRGTRSIAARAACRYKGCAGAGAGAEAEAARSSAVCSVAAADVVSEGVLVTCAGVFVRCRACVVCTEIVLRKRGQAANSVPFAMSGAAARRAGKDRK